MRLKVILPLLFLGAGPLLAQENPIIHDGEYQFLRAQFAEAWDAQDVEVDARLAEIRAANGGQPPNFLYILIDDVSFGQMGERKMNYVMGIETPNINQLANRRHVADAHVYRTLMHANAGCDAYRSPPRPRWRRRGQGGAGG